MKDIVKKPAISLGFIFILFIQHSTSRLSSDAAIQQQSPKYISITANRDTCIGCFLLVSVIEQLAQVHNTTVLKSMELLCSYLPEEYALRGMCTMLAEIFGPELVKLFSHNWNADVICHAINLCNTDPRYPICHLSPKSKKGFKKSIKKAEKIVKQSTYLSSEVISGVLIKICSIPFLKRICEILESSIPLQDFDKDNFSSFPTMRGYDWRGRDCNDANNSVYPGRRPANWDSVQDSNCNGISGVDTEDGIPYEKKFCEGTDAKGIILLGDSAGAHFHIPPEWLTAKTMSEKTFSNLPLAISNELDWPQFSQYTGYENSTIGGWTNSLYLRLRKSNRCNHRDYQNISRNGGSSHNLLDFLKSLARNQQLDKPAVVFYAMIGNDVCNAHADTLSQMTTPQKMLSNVMGTLEYLDSHLPNGSHVIFIGLADGRFLWDTLHNRYHPIGELNKDVTYAQLYSFLSCLQSNPCEGWMNQNETLRNLTTERAEQLSNVLKEIALSKKFKNFDVFYIEHLYQKVISEWTKMGKAPWDLIEPVDGFHPNQIASALGADIIWKEVTQTWPEVFGKENPYNEAIIAKFADQGGH
ncbi:acyloxyacyl hydrolase isoform X2 [Bombina bombina]|uniref:acyloxyacyl hydrolase isoform X2 n=1 Tax=Bombina bombina TaxID=8345 RepID=UPI00235A7103|nr:acyloxyacyl hydrolase isoform X2 [Bombina bombina]